MTLKTVLITGSSRGIGAACARAFAADRYNVVLNCRSSLDKAKALQKELNELYGCAAIVCKADVSQPEEVESLFSQAEEAFGRVDVLVNNAGISKIKVINDVTPAEWDDLFAVNTKSAYLCAKRAVSGFLQNHWGRIINISSFWGIVGASCEVPYSASKAALIGFTKSLAKELAPAGVTVNAVAPGFIDTDMNATLSDEERRAFLAEVPVSRSGTPMEVAQTVRFFASEDAGYITGQTLAVDGGYTA